MTDDLKARRKELEVRKLLAEAAEAEANARQAEIKLAVAEQAEFERLNNDEHNRVYRLIGEVSDASVNPAITTLSRWSRIDPGCDITFVINSPGGAVVAGMALFDELKRLSRAGHKITTVAQGWAASMGGVLLQAGDHRVMTEGSSLLIHEASFGAAGSFSKVEDMVEWVRKMQERILTIFEERASVTRKTIERNWRRKDWWLNPQESLKYGFIDEVR